MIVEDEYFSCSSDDYESAQSLNSSLSDSDPLEDKLSNIFSNNSKFLSLVHINAQSIPAHYNDLLTSFSAGVVDSILVSETWLKPSLPSTSCSIPGYKLFRNDRTGCGGGGVGVYLRSHIPADVVCSSQSQYTGSLEYLFLSVVVHHKKILLGVLYSPNDKTDYFNTLEGTLVDLVPLFDHVVLMGDLNTCILKNNYRSDKLLALTSALDLQVLTTLKPTHYFPNSRPSLIDLMIVSHPKLVLSHGQMDAPFSHHDLIFLSYRVRPPKVKGKVRLLRNFKHMDLVRLREDIGRVDWSLLFSSDSIDVKVDILNTELVKIYDSHAPVRPVRVRHAPAPWLSPEIRRVMVKRDRAKCRLKREPSLLNLEAYKKLRNLCNRMCRDAKRRYIHSTIQNLSQAQVWKFLHSIGVGESMDVCQSNVDLNALNSHFSTPPVILNHLTKSSTLSSLSNLVPPVCPPFTFNMVSEETVMKCVRSISTKAIGSDNLSLDMILPVLEDIAPVVTHIINYSLSRNVFPAQWKKAFVIPLPKIPNPTSLSQYRPISILPILSKALESIDTLFSPHLP
ncbi:uncharacterized protein LOC113237729 [Hyposmocoma kahamanoa]|uniref:uncharacterized protein LOC113237729 n=1 Tax=Hyposmocoma kahamanoa TaxID=1477025 RepID=UPI000E6D80FC|nr:uncharacterized protein LOC113237729 [Hyposmocoma kahamanoa]